MTSGTPVIRPAVEADREHMWPLVRDFAVSYTPREDTFPQALSGLLLRADTLVAVAERDATALVGYVLASCHGTFFANGRVAWVEELMVAESARHAGVGRSLLAHAERWATAIPAAYVALASRRAGDFYRSVGYETSATYFEKGLA